MPKQIQAAPIDMFALKSIETDHQYDSSDTSSDIRDERTSNSMEESLRPSEGTEFNSNIKNSIGEDEMPVELNLRISQVYKFKTE